MTESQVSGAVMDALKAQPVKIGNLKSARVPGGARKSAMRNYLYCMNTTLLSTPTEKKNRRERELSV